MEATTEALRAQSPALRPLNIGEMEAALFCCKNMSGVGHHCVAKAGRGP